jgi:hypothetical protein
MSTIPRIILGVAPCKKKTCCPVLQVVNPGTSTERFDLIDDEDNVCSMSRERFLLIVQSHKLYFENNPEADSAKLIEFGKVKISLERLTELTNLYFQSQNNINQGLPGERVWG